MIVIIGAPLTVALCIYPVLNGETGLKMSYGTSLGFCFVIAAYYLISEIERVYKID